MFLNKYDKIFLMTYQPPQKTLEKYADVLVNFALNNGKGIKKNEVVFLQVPECAKSMLIELRKKVLEANAHAIIQFLPDNMGREFYQLANQNQLEFFPQKYLKGVVSEADHFLALIADTDKHELEGIDPRKIMSRAQVFRPYQKWRQKKEERGQLTWTIGLFATSAMAKEVNLSLKEYWRQIIDACFLTEDRPIAKWQKVQKKIQSIKQWLNDLKITGVHIQSERIDLNLAIGANRQWSGGEGNNIPSFEIFTTPNYHYTSGNIFFNQPLYINGQLVKDISLQFKKGRVVKAQAKKGNEFLQAMIKLPGADQVGEFSLTDRRFSNITHFMGETLYDENRGGQWGNTHIALGFSYRQCLSKSKELSEQEWQKLGFNDSVIHTDMVSTTNRIVTATLQDKSKKIIYKNGRFTS